MFHVEHRAPLGFVVQIDVPTRVRTGRTRVQSVVPRLLTVLGMTASGGHPTIEALFEESDQDVSSPDAR